MFSIKSPRFGGLSRWNVLGDLGITNIMRGYFRKPPQIVEGLLLHEAAEAWCQWRPRALERGLARVVFAIPSAYVGCYSKWNVLEDRTMSSATRGYYRKPPVVITGLMTQEAEKVWRGWNPIIWTVIEWRGLFGGQFARAGRSPG